jgi:hypothetical protein
MSGPDGDGRRVGFVLATARDIPSHKQFSAEDLRQCLMALLYSTRAQDDQHTGDHLRGLAHRVRQAAVALREGRQAEPAARCYAWGRPVQ